MNNRPRIGELLSEIVHLSGHDVEEILHEQRTTSRRFGEIALSWGLCQPEHVWSAWCRQVPEASACETVDLDRDGIDAQAVALFLPETARAIRAVPLRWSDSEVVLACEMPLSQVTCDEISRLLKKRVKCVLAAKEQIDAAIEVYYPV